MSEVDVEYWRGQVELYKAQIPHLIREAEKFSKAYQIARAWIETIVERGITDDTSGVQDDVERVLAELDRLV